jgi:hypothetical protein
MNNPGQAASPEETSMTSVSTCMTFGRRTSTGRAARARARSALRLAAVWCLGALVASPTLALADAAPPAAPPSSPPAGSFQIPGTSTTLAVGGMIKLDVLFSSVSVGGAGGSNSGDQFLLPSSIPVGSEKDENGQITFHPRASRFFLKTDTPTDWGALGTYLEMDFFQFSAPGDERVSNGYAPNLRHAYARFGRLLAGQTWTTFMSAAALPEVNDYVGPVAAVFVRQPQLRWTQPIGPLSLDIAVESPESTFRGADGKRVTPDDDRMPDLVLKLGASDGWGEVALAGLVREIRSDGAVVSGVEDSTVAGAVNVSGRVRTVGLDDVRFVAVWGDGVGRYVGLNVFDDGSLDAAGHVRAIPVYGGFVAYRHWWTESWRSSAAYGYLGANPSPGSVPDSTSNEVQSFHGNVMWSPVSQVTFGLEYVWATRSLESHEHGDLNRVTFAAKYTF